MTHCYIFAKNRYVTYFLIISAVGRFDLLNHLLAISHCHRKLTSLVFLIAL